MMAMNKSYFPLTYYMKNHPKFGDFWQILFNEYSLSKEMMFEITGFQTLMEEEPVGRKSVKIRENIVSVSYTHLDVYKRQVLKMLLFLNCTQKVMQERFCNCMNVLYKNINLKKYKKS